MRLSTGDGRVTGLTPFAGDRDPSEIGPSIAELLDHPTRSVAPPRGAAGWENGPGPAQGGRGGEPFVEIGWDEAERLVAAELERVRSRHGNRAIYAGSYGWASAGRFHHAQSQIHRFLNCIGGYTRSVNTYSYAAAEVAVPHVLGGFAGFSRATQAGRISRRIASFSSHSAGWFSPTARMGNGGVGDHVQRAGYRQAVDAGVEFVNISPTSPRHGGAGAPALDPVRPNSDTALILALCHTLHAEGLADTAFLSRCTVGYDRFAAYLDGAGDGVVKDASWAAALTGVPASGIEALARRMASKRTMLSISWSLTRQQYGEQPCWAAITLAAMLGQIGTPGGGVGFGYAVANYVGHNVAPLPFAALPQGTNNVADFIPVARVSDMLLNPGGEFAYNGGTYRYPDIRLVYWAGGNPFHHHQDLNRLAEAWQRPDSVIIHDWCWNAAAKRADIVLPCTTMLERTDIGMTPRDPYVFAMHKAVDPVGEARDDYDILAGIAREMGCGDSFCEGRSAGDWVRHLWSESRARAAAKDVELPDYDALAAAGWHRLPRPEDEPVMFAAFRQDPKANPLRTPSGLIEIWSGTVAGFGYPDCPGHAAWNEPDEWLGTGNTACPLHLLGKQPETKLHSQLDPGAHSRSGKVRGHEAVEINSRDAAARGIADGDPVMVRNARGGCICGAVVSDDLMPGVVMVSTGAWFRPLSGRRGRGPGLQAWQSERADAGHRHIAPVAGAGGAQLPRRDQPV